MKLCSYKSNQSGWKGVFNRLIRIRLRGDYSHTEVMFEPSDGVDELMPDGTCDPINGAYWFASASATEVLPAWSKRRPGKHGGVRFKRITPNTDKWDFDEINHKDKVSVAKWFREHEGALYDWRLIFGYIVWLFSESEGRYECAESCAAAFGIMDAWRFDPVNLPKVIRFVNSRIL